MLAHRSVERAPAVSRPAAGPHGMLLMLCDQCALERCLAEGEIGSAVPKGTVAGVRVGCLPDQYAALASDPPDQVITL